MDARRRIFTAAMAGMLGFGSLPVGAQTFAPGTAPGPVPVETAPLAPLNATPAPLPAPAGAPPSPAPSTPMPPAASAPQSSGATITQTPPPGTPPSAVTQQAARPTLIPQPGDPSNVDDVVLPERDVLIVSGQSNWTDGLKNIRAAFERLEAELAKAGIAPAGRPLSVFTSTTDDDFRFDAMMPIDRVPGTPPPADMRFGKSPSGKAYRFTHKAAYEEIDSTYETITTYLDAKEILAKDAFIEEYVNDISDPADTNLEVNIFVQPK